MNATKFATRALHVLMPDDYTYPEWDVVARCDDGKFRYSDEVFDTADGAEVFAAGLELDSSNCAEWGTCTAAIPKELL